jgi:hypothetical protein
MEAGSGHEDSSHNILTLDALQVLSRSQVTLSCQCPCGYGPICKVAYIHIHWHDRRRVCLHEMNDVHGYQLSFISVPLSG